ncbi:hypothetical protein Clacol_002043 [Clathrus columnatus]|uniref:ATP-dependent RNA helicase n=1 Tax=Clathrus columnatus TaxID=1419009 RepID=A0AAV5A3P9_9AGAM|nr:hypothetical protein Clacol_002043 [Clathrus columnatus]
MSERHLLKRKLGPSKKELSRKRLKGKPEKTGVNREKIISNSSLIPTSQETCNATADQLPWKTVRTPLITGLGDDGEGGMMELEEVEGVEVVYEDDEAGHGRVARFRVAEQQILSDSRNANKKEAVTHPPIEIEPFDIGSLPSWSKYPIHSGLLHSLYKRQFAEPTPIQRETFDVVFGTDLRKTQVSGTEEASSKEQFEDDSGKDSSIGSRDIIGIAQTGSGKTLAYGLPILNHLLHTLCDESLGSTTTITVPSIAPGERRSIKALILTPTRELAMQVTEHLNKCLDVVFHAQRDQWSTHNGNNSMLPSSEHTTKPPPPVSVATIVGGMSSQKQRRVLSRGVDILVVTPGRFWDLCQEDPWLAPQLRSLQFLVLDEADRMIETGHFQELDHILRLTARETIQSTETENPSPPADVSIQSSKLGSVIPNNNLQTFIFSATLSKELQRDLKSNKRRKTKTNSATTLDELLMKLDFRDPNPVVIDLSPEGGKVQGLQESIVECLTANKDVYLYYFLLRHPGKSLVFLASIDGIRRLLPLLELLKIPAWPLHSGLQQKQRLKNFDRFKSTPNAVLLATDIAARGLDVPAVDHVIHYQVPRTADTYVHRNGRTARAMQEGFGLVLCAPDEKRAFKGVLTGLGRSEDDIPELNIDRDILNKLKGQIQLAKQIDGMMHKVKKQNHEKNWMKETAEAMEVELGSEFDESDNSEIAAKPSRRRNTDSKVTALKAELNHALAQPLVARGVSTRYITSGTRAIADDLLAGNSHEKMLGLSKLKAGSEISPPPEELSAVHDELLGLAHSLYNLGMTVLEDLSKEKVGETGATVEKPVGARVNDVVQHLAAIDKLSQNIHTMIPWSVLVEIDNGKNPANLTRQHIERLATENQWMNGKVDAILSYKTRLDAALEEHFPSLVPYFEKANETDRQPEAEREDVKPIIMNGTNGNYHNPSSSVGTL